MTPQTNIPGTERETSSRLQKLSEELREQLAHNAQGRAREKELRRQILSEVLGAVPEYRELVEQLLALPTPAVRYVDGAGIEIESVATFELKANVHPTGDRTDSKADQPKKRAKPEPADKEFDEDSIPDPDDNTDGEARAAAAAQLDANVQEDDDGDVIPIEQAPKKRGKSKVRRKR